MKKSAQSMSFPFKAIFITVVSVLILFFGYRVVDHLINLGDEAEVQVFYENLENKIKNCYSLDTGSICSLSTIRIPSTIKQVCFINIDASMDNIQDRKIKILAETSARENVFLVKKSDAKIRNIKTKVDNFEVEGGSFCFDVISGKIIAELENQGTHVEIR